MLSHLLMFGLPSKAFVLKLSGGDTPTKTLRHIVKKWWNHMYFWPKHPSKINFLVSETRENRNELPSNCILTSLKSICPTLVRRGHTDENFKTYSQKMMKNVLFFYQNSIQKLTFWYLNRVKLGMIPHLSIFQHPSKAFVPMLSGGDVPSPSPLYTQITN